MQLLDLRGQLDRTSQAFFRFRRLGPERTLITNAEGRWLILSDADFAAYATGAVVEGSELYRRLSDGNFLRATWDEAKARDMIAARKQFLGYGPNLHVMVVTLRCNETCVYCHASRADMDATHTDMTPEIAEKAVDLAFMSTSPSITIEFQGGEPLVRYDLVKHIIEYAKAKNETAGKTVEFTMVSNLSLMDDEKLDYLLEHKVQMCTSIDGPKDLHDKQRILPTLSAYDAASSWIEKINRAYVDRGLDPSLYHVEALVTTTKGALGRAEEIVDTYAALGCRALFLRPIDPFGFASKTAKMVEYPRADYLRFYAEATDYILELNRQGTQMIERYAAIFLTKILRGEDPNFLDLRSPAGAGISMLAYSYDGDVYTCDEGRMLAAQGDQTFRIGNVFESSYRDLVGHPTVRAMVIASNLDSQPDCVDCTYNPYCGIQTTHNHKTQGSIFGRMRESNVCAVHKGIQDYLFGKLADGEPHVLEAFERWTTVRAREHFLHDGAGSADGDP
ncbi:MAG: His-Xaa-Ser system radical SAM maturase HxsB [Sandaracinaceae bacterium]|nr:His-Xaa-Ser system radical SAM maturase HxsB [Sandaracinaceae bacterium]